MISATISGSRGRFTVSSKVASCTRGPVSSRCTGRISKGAAVIYTFYMPRRSRPLILEWIDRTQLQDLCEGIESFLGLSEQQRIGQVLRGECVTIVLIHPSLE